ncbi:hypothetical protein [Polaribacter sp. L3A8]|uniref:hypothetical protein n=1 Tax=Polaribacter sp. L3A8 TaxID=2686361 RepID=UPI00131CE01D|nr:hypothetical protein [Polaribacter sp. L3A8]
MTTERIKDLDIVNCINAYAIIDNKYWVNKQQIAKQLDISVNELQDIVKNSETIVINNEGKLTTRKLYQQKTPFLDKLLNTIKNKIE